MKINLDELTLGPITNNSIERNEEGLVAKLSGDNNCFLTPCEYNLPLRISVKAKTDSTNIRLYYSYGEVIFNWECQLDELRVHDVKYGQPFGFPGLGSVPCNKFVDIVWEIRKDGMEISVDGETRLKSSDFPYINELKSNPDLKFSSTVGIGSAWGSTVTIKELNVTEL